jgi:hypothetical protein
LIRKRRVSGRRLRIMRQRGQLILSRAFKFNSEALCSILYSLIWPIFELFECLENSSRADNPLCLHNVHFIGKSETDGTELLDRRAIAI